MHSLVVTLTLFDAAPRFADGSSRLRCLRAAGDAFERVEVLLIRIREGVEVLLSGLDLCVTHAVHDALQIRAAGEQPGCVRVTEVVDADGEVDTAGRDGREPDVGAEAVAGDRGADLGGEEQVVAADAVGR